MHVRSESEPNATGSVVESAHTDPSFGVIQPRQSVEQQTVLHPELFRAVIDSIDTVTEAPRSEVHLHEIVAGRGTGKTVLLGRLRQRYSRVDDRRDRPIVVALSGRGGTSDVDTASALVIGQIKHALDSQDSRRRHDRVLKEARNDVLSGLSAAAMNFAASLMPGISTAVSIAQGAVDVHKHVATMRSVREAQRQLGLAPSGSDALTLTTSMLNDAAGDWQTASGARRAPTLVLLVDDVDACVGELVEWLSQLVENVVEADGLAMSVVAVTTAETDPGRPIEPDGEPVQLLSGVAVDKTRWRDGQAGLELGDHRLTGWRTRDAVAAADELLSHDIPGAERRALVQDYARIPVVSAGDVNPLLVTQHVREILFRRRIGIVDAEWLSRIGG